MNENNNEDIKKDLDNNEEVENDNVNDSNKSEVNIEEIKEIENYNIDEVKKSTFKRELYETPIKKSFKIGVLYTIALLAFVFINTFLGTTIWDSGFVIVRILIILFIIPIIVSIYFGVVFKSIEHFFKILFGWACGFILTLCVGVFTCAGFIMLLSY